ncbi:MAG: hypothetical protein AAGE96_10880 [Cyanobacteria bacterium P01_G01_bin.19]
MKTIYRSKSYDKLVDRQQDANNNRPTNWGQIAERLDDLDDRCVRLAAYAEPQVCEKHDRFGDTYFRVYDPQSDRYLDFHSHNEVKCWLEQHYYL